MPKWHYFSLKVEDGRTDEEIVHTLEHMMFYPEPRDGEGRLEQGIKQPPDISPHRLLRYAHHVYETEGLPEEVREGVLKLVDKMKKIWP